MGHVIFEYILHFIYFLLLSTSFIYIDSLLLSPLNDAPGDIVDDESSFQFFSEAEFTSTLYVHFTLATDTEAEPLQGPRQEL